MCLTRKKIREGWRQSVSDSESNASEDTRILSAIRNGDAQAAKELLPLVYDELRRLAAFKLAHENPGQTLQPTALVHEAWLRRRPGESGLERPAAFFRGGGRGDAPHSYRQR